MDTNYENSPAILFVSPIQSRQIPLTKSAEAVGLEVLLARRCCDARALLRKHSDIAVVVADVTLPEGNWCEILRWMIDDRMDARLVLISPVSNAALWSEAVRRGAYDVLVEPFAAWEFSRSVEGALRNRLSYTHLFPAPPESGGESLRRADSLNPDKRVLRATSSGLLPAAVPA